MNKINCSVLILIMILTSFGCTKNPSGDSLISKNHTPLLQPPSPFSFIQTKASKGIISLAWSPSIRATEYKVYSGTSPSSITTLVPSCTGTNSYCDLSGFPDGVLYYFNVVASNPVANKDINSITSAMSISAFDILSSDKGDQYIDLTWSAATGSTSYKILYGTSSGAYSNTISNVTSPYTLTGLSNGINYYVRVEAINANNGSSLSDSQIIQKPFGPPPAPAGISLIANPNVMTLTWDPVIGADSYKIYRGTVSGSLTLVPPSITGNLFQDNTVTNGTTYFYALEGFNGYTSPRSAEFSARGINAFDMTSVAPGSAANQMIINWPVVTGAAQYNISYGTNPAALSSEVTNVTSPATITGLSGGSTYYFRVTALNSVGVGARQSSTNQLSGTPIPAIPAPTGLVASATPTQIVLNWNSVPGASSYEVLRGLTSGSYTSLQAGILGNTFTDTGLSNGTSYFYVVKAYNALPSVNSTQASAKPIADFSLTSVSPISSSSLQVTWPATNGADAYDVLYGTAPGSYTSTASGATSPYTITGLSPATTYYIVVKGRNAVGSGTNRITGQLSGLTKTTAPAGLTASTLPGKVILDWVNVPGATSYNVYRGTVSGTHTLHISGLTNSDYQDSSVLNGTSYYYVIKASNGSLSDNSNEVVAKSIASLALTSLASMSTSSIEVAWPAVQGGDSFDIQYGTTTGTYSTTLTNKTSPFLITGLSSGTNYFIRVIAKNAIGAGSTVNSNELSQGTPVGPPTGLIATAGLGQITLSWDSMAGASSYKIYRGTTSGSYSLIASNVVSLNYLNNTGITNGTTYFYVVRSYNGYDSAESSEVSAKTIAPFSMSSVTGTSPSTLEVSWSSTLGGDLYDVRYGTTSGSYTTISGVTSPYTITGLSGNTNYYVVVRARNTVGSGAEATTPELSRITPISAPNDLSAVATPSKVTLSWSAVSGANSYKIWRGTSTGIHTEIATAITTLTYNDTSVVNGSTYYYVIKAFNGSDSAKSNEVVSKPIASFNIASTTAVSSSRVDLTWAAVAGADTYDISYGTSSGTYTTTVSGVSSPYAVTSLAPASTYFFIVTARNSVGSGTARNSAETGATTAFGAPSGLAAVATPGQVNLTWNAVSGASSYKVLRGTVLGTYTTIATGVGIPAHTDTGLANGTTYFYVVRAFNGTDSANSGEVSVKPIASFSLATAVVNSSSSITLTWGAAAGADSFDVQYGASSGIYLGTVTGVTSPYTLTGLSAGTLYYISIRAKNTVGSGTNYNSNELSRTTSMGAPTGLIATGTPGQVGLNWNSMSGASSYKVYRGVSSGVYTEIATGVVSSAYIDTGRTNGTVYYYAVKAFNGTDSAASSEVEVKTIASVTFSSAVAASSTSANLTWASAAGADTYDVRYGTASGVYLGTVTNVTSAYTLTGLSPATLYYVSIRANNTNGSGTTLQSNELTVTTATAAATSLTATTSASQINLSWTGVSGATSYRVYRGTTSGTHSQIATNINGTTYSDTGPVNGTTYFYVIRAFNGSESSNSNEASGAPIGSFSISGTTATNATNIQVSWNAVTGATAYDVLYGTSTGSYGTTVSNVSSPYTISGLSGNTLYYIVVKARNSVGSGTSTNSSEVSQITPLAGPTGLTAIGNTSQINLSWTAVSGSTSYKVLRGTVSGTYVEIASGITGTTYSDTGRINGTTYFYAVRAYNGTDSANSSEASAQPISAFSITSVDGNSSSSVMVTWPAATGAATYDIKYGTISGSPTSTIFGVTSPFAITALTAGQTYFVTVVAKNAIGNGAQANSTEASGSPNSPPVVSFISAQSTPADTAIAVNFTLSDSNHLLTCAGAMSGTSSNTSLVLNTSIVFSGTIPNCTGTITPVAGQVGTSTITFTANDSISTTSQNFVLTVTPCAVASIVWETQPTGMAAGSLFAATPRVSLRKADNSLCTTNLAPVILGVSLDVSVQQDAVITSVASAIPSGGYALFSGARMERSGTGYTVEASQNGVISLASSTFNVTALAASKIVFSQQPQTAGRLATMIPSPMIRTADTYGNYVAVNALGITLSLQSNEEGSTLNGTLAKNTSNLGIAEFTNLSLNVIGNYFIRATPANGPYTFIDSTPFNVLEITPQNTTAVVEMLAGPIVHVTNRTNYPRASIPLGTNILDGVTAYTWKIVAKNTDTQASTVRLRVGATNTNTTISVPAGTTVPTLFSTTIANNTITADGTWLIRVESGGAEVYSSRIITKQTGANRTQAFIPLLSFENTLAASSIDVTNTTYVANTGMNFPAYDWDGSTVAKIDSALLYVVSKTTGASACAALFNKTTNTQIGSEICNASAGETAVSINIDPLALANLVGELEVRTRTTLASGPATFYKAGLLLRIVSIEKMLAIQRVAPAVASLGANTNFVEQRASSYISDYGIGVVNEYLDCSARAAAVGSGTFNYKNHGTTTSGSTTPAPSTIAASAITFSNQGSLTTLQAGPIASTNANNQFMSYTHTSGIFTLSQCLLSTLVTY
ncbi:MAG TPA: fibronectin type III domain-containing protein [Bacteriovoracaceae bacterium]|nr:fibronectin type III domain-containing protein [Bacteriovoracaceae bacterium]